MSDYIERVDNSWCQSQALLDTWPRLSSLGYKHLYYLAERAAQYPKTITQNATWDELKEIVAYNTTDKQWFSS
jgi:hypothetical protein